MKQTAASIIVAAIAIFCGLFFVELDMTAYEIMNGPPLVSDRFFTAINKMVVAPECREFLIEWKSKDCVFLAQYPETDGCAHLMKIKRRGSNSFDVSTAIQYFPDGKPNNPKYKKQTGVSLLSLNRLVDKNYYPDATTRAIKKRYLLKMLEFESEQGQVLISL